MRSFNCWGSCLFIGLLIMSYHVMGWAPAWAIGGPWSWSRLLNSNIVGLKGITGSVQNMLSSCLIILS